MREVWWICGSLMHVMFYNVANFHNRIQSASYLLARPYELRIGRRKFELRERETWSLTDFVAHRQNDRAFFFSKPDRDSPSPFGSIDRAVVQIPPFTSTLPSTRLFCRYPILRPQYIA